ncbi:hypothetical protein [Nonomuraea sp. NPDC049504]|uniref:hypothetical protein n=1 Tax=Nonomuraea sp. NPDC049504 TaxID=3154729 RepID=UPI0034350A72
MLSERPGPAGARRRRVLGVSALLAGVLQLAVAGVLIGVPGSSPTLDPLTFPYEEDARGRRPLSALSPRPIATPTSAPSGAPSGAPSDGQNGAPTSAPTGGPTGGPTSGPRIGAITSAPSSPATAGPKPSTRDGGSARPRSREGEAVPPRAARTSPREVSVLAPETPPLVAGRRPARTPRPWRTQAPSGLVQGHQAAPAAGR